MVIVSKAKDLSVRGDPTPSGGRGSVHHYRGWAHTSRLRRLGGHSTPSAVSGRHSWQARAVSSASRLSACSREMALTRGPVGRQKP